MSLGRAALASSEDEHPSLYAPEQGTQAMHGPHVHCYLLYRQSHCQLLLDPHQEWHPGCNLHQQIC